MRKFGLIGFPLEHSFSATFFSEKFFRDGLSNCSYQNYPIQDIRELPELIRDDPLLKGLNITIPYKEQVIPYLDKIDDRSQKIGTVNCIDIRNGQLVGYNTDYLGFLKSIRPLIRSHHRRALVLGTGGSSKTVVYVLNQLGVETTLVSRTKGDNVLSYDQITEEVIISNTIIVNTTPLGMAPDVAASPKLPYQYIGSQHLMYDLIYNPEITVFLLKGRQQDAVTKNGLEMLQIQAEESWEIWNREFAD